MLTKCDLDVYQKAQNIIHYIRLRNDITMSNTECTLTTCDFHDAHKTQMQPSWCRKQDRDLSENSHHEISVSLFIAECTIVFSHVYDTTYRIAKALGCRADIPCCYESPQTVRVDVCYLENDPNSWLRDPDTDVRSIKSMRRRCLSYWKLVIAGLSYPPQF